MTRVSRTVAALVIINIHYSNKGLFKQNAKSSKTMARDLQHYVTARGPGCIARLTMAAP